MAKNIYEILDEFQVPTKKQDKQNILKFNYSPALEQVLQGTFHPAINFVFKRPLKYNRSDAPPGMGYTGLHQVLERVYIFVEGSTRVNPQLTYDRKEQLAIQFLEALESKEADVFMNMMLKDLKVPYLTYNFVKETFPDILP